MRPLPAALPPVSRIPVLDGLAYYPRTWQLLRSHRELWGYLAWPLVLNLVVGSALTVAGIFAGWQAVDGLVAGLPAWLAALGPVLHGLVVVLVCLAVAFLVARAGVVLGAPWYDALSEHIEAIVAPEAARPAVSPWPFGWLVDVGRALRWEAQKGLLALGVALVVLAMNVVPVVGQIAGAALAVGTAILFGCLDAMDASLERRRLGFRAKLGLVLGQGPLVLGFGGPAAVLVGLPFLNLLAVPFLMAAGTLIYCERLAERATPSPR